MQNASMLRWLQALIAVLFCAAAVIASPAQTLTTLVNFDGSNGGNPANMSLTQATDGNLWGTTLIGGSTYVGGVNQGEGTVFKITPSGGFKIVYSFCIQSNCTDGSYPYAPVVQGTDGNFYGTTSGGGAYNGGSVFKLTPQGQLTTLYSFCQVKGCPDGTNIYAGLIQASDGDFYGVAEEGGKVGGCGCGTVFKITAKGKLTTLHNFKGSDGSSPEAALIEASNGVFYGTTSAGGAHGYGTVFKMTASGKVTTLHTFCTQSGCPDGTYPYASLLQGSDSNFYGTTYAGGANNFGTVFRITPQGKLTTLHNFDNDGIHPQAPLIQATDGNFYGTTYDGDGLSEPCKAGCVFQITPTGKFRNLFQFNSQTDGLHPIGGLIQDTNGKLYGSTYQGGSFGDGADSGTIFKLATGFGPFVTTTPTFGKVGAAVVILGTNLTGATAVSFNGKAATFKVVSKSEITTTVPVGATSGKVQVKTPRGILKSNPAFVVE